MPLHLPVLQNPNTVFRTKEDAKTDCGYCRSPCCQLLVTLLPAEIPKYENEMWPFPGGDRAILKRRPEDGYCVYYVHGVGCSTYEDKPYVCDYYSCRNDTRITPSLKYGKVKKFL